MAQAQNFYTHDHHAALPPTNPDAKSKGEGNVTGHGTMGAIVKYAHGTMSRLGPPYVSAGDYCDRRYMHLVSRSRTTDLYLHMHTHTVM